MVTDIDKKTVNQLPYCTITNAKTMPINITKSNFWFRQYEWANKACPDNNRWYKADKVYLAFSNTIIQCVLLEQLHNFQPQYHYRWVKESSENRSMAHLRTIRTTKTAGTHKRQWICPHLQVNSAIISIFWRRSSKLMILIWISDTA